MTAACGCQKTQRGCGPKCGCYGNTGGRHPCNNPFTVAGAARPRPSASEGSRARSSVQQAFGGQGFSLGSSGGATEESGSLTPCPICSRMVPRDNVAMHAARCGVPQRPSATAVAEHERQFTRMQQESEYEAALREDEEKVFAEQERMADEEKAAKRQRRCDFSVVSMITPRMLTILLFCRVVWRAAARTSSKWCAGGSAHHLTITAAIPRLGSGFGC